MREYLPLLIVGAVIGTFSLAFVLAYAAMKNKKEAVGFDRNIPDSEIIRRLMVYARPYWKQFLLALVIMLVSVSYSLAGPLIIGRVEETVKDSFEPGVLWRWLGLYAGILIVSLVCTYFQSMILQKTGQKILSALRQEA